MPGVNKVHEVQELPVLDKRKEWITEEPLEQLEQDLSPCKQLRGATIPQKYVAEKEFPILQDAWAAFISQNIRSTIT